MVLNEEGWAITAGHVFDEIEQAQQSIAGAAAIDEAVSQLERQKTANATQRNREMRRLHEQKQDSLSHHVEIWAAGADWHLSKPRATELRRHPGADLAAFKLSQFTPALDQVYPKFRTNPITAGLSVCRVGYPWHSVEAVFSDDNFEVQSGFPAPLFANDGIVSRFVVVQQPDGSDTTYIQTSSPGLRGQSGGPLFDTEASLCGLQSSTTHLDLGFAPTFSRDGQNVVEHQFLNVGQAVHVDEIRRFLDSHHIRYHC